MTVARGVCIANDSGRKPPRQSMGTNSLSVQV